MKFKVYGVDSGEYNNATIISSAHQPLKKVNDDLLQLYVMKLRIP